MFMNNQNEVKNYDINPLASPLTDVKLFPSNQGYGFAAVDGRANLGKLNADNSKATKFSMNSIMSFKCHKVEVKDPNNSGNATSALFSVNSIGFNKVHENFVFTAGSDGQMHYWDFQQKNKIKTFYYANQPVTKAEMDDSGTLMAYALGYDWSQGINGLDRNIPNKLCVHAITPNELKYTKTTN